MTHTLAIHSQALLFSCFFIIEKEVVSCIFIIYLKQKHYIEAFHYLARELAKHPDIELLGYHNFAGLSAAAVDALESKYQCRLDPAMRHFYQQTNGLQLRWIFKDNPAYQSGAYPPFHQQTAPVPWDYASTQFLAEDACIMLLPLEHLLRKSIVPDLEMGTIQLDGQQYSSIDFYTQLRPLDLFSYYGQMGILFRNRQAPLVLLGDEGGQSYNYAQPTTFATYIDFLLASKGLCQRRSGFFMASNGEQLPLIKNISQQQQQRWALKHLHIHRHFPESDWLSIAPSVASRTMQQQAQQQKPLSQDLLSTLQEAHADFMASGGDGGQWQTIALKGRSVGIYLGAKATAGKQAILDMQHLSPKLFLQDLHLPYSSWCGVYAKGQDFSDANLTGSLFIDANLEQSIFAEANLENVDFSRANLQGASFVNANLQGADFEQANLVGADFRGAILTGSRFKGAILRQVNY